MLFDLRCAFKRGGNSDIPALFFGGMCMRRLIFTCVAVAMIVPTTAWAQDRASASAPVVVEFDAAGNPLPRNRPISCSEMQTRTAARNAERERALAAGEEPPPPYIGTCVADPVPVAADAVAEDDSRRRIAFDPNAGLIGEGDPSEQSEFDLAYQQRLNQRRAAQPSACATQSDIVGGTGAQRPQYDANGALIRQPAATCTPPPPAATRRTTTDSGLIVERESSGGCTEDPLTRTRTCRSSGTISIGNSEEGNERARQLVEDMLNDLQRD